MIGANMDRSDAMLLGRRTYEEWAGYWPGKTAADDPFAEYINDVPKYVVSRTLKRTTRVGGIDPHHQHGRRS